ncbi:MAG TPA: helix-turn-helix domain-containing protein [Trinickia sp.]|jgi:excisionase family DNA binding protein|uniref:helix-turn-helix transcriptional regulator n=1 Tax=Trinickia sp. TaxID=2571163 RepID=UPI002C471C33|nr:helix-turn-helix domain-containing protein [Trinickia sp.]HTI18994.1 helix-turn-helix domain-containing protein [Trinickia sp.]
MATTLPKLHRINDVAAALGVSRQTIYRMVRRGVLTLVKIGPNSSGITDASVQRLAGSQHGS